MLFPCSSIARASDDIFLFVRSMAVCRRWLFSYSSHGYSGSRRTILRGFIEERPCSYCIVGVARRCRYISFLNSPGKSKKGDMDVGFDMLFALMNPSSIS